MSTPISDPDKTPIDPLIQQAMNGLPDDFSDFARIYQNELRPTLLGREGERQAAAQEASRWTWVGTSIGVVGAALALMIARVPQLAIVAGVIGFAVVGAGRSKLRKFSREAKTLLVQPVAQQFDLAFTEDPGHQSTILHIHKQGLVPGWDRANFEDRITGVRRGVEFEFFEAHLEDKRTTTDSRGRTRTRWVTVFNGQCLRFRFHKDFLGQTLVTRDSGIFNIFGRGGELDRVRLESPQFEKAFEVYSTDQVEARYLLTPDLMQRLVELEKTFRGGGLRCAFVGGEMLVALEGGDLFEPGSMFTPLDNPDRIRELLDDFAAIFNLIDSFADPDERLRLGRSNPLR